MGFPNYLLSSFRKASVFVNLEKSSEKAGKGSLNTMGGGGENVKKQKTPQRDLKSVTSRVCASVSYTKGLMVVSPTPQKSPW